ncbi:nuclear receptor coactivator 7 isoform X2 [Scleropages formosus]|uniref:nuclear receptor coactivator 7 isoform X2 n=1 Tax=Scleropages formosus TaxID=113540 RepID=UPI0010FABDDA|nr:nuclear receptor coactivator 7-like isoform X2 [Scleropages formosus]
MEHEPREKSRTSFFSNVKTSPQAPGVQANPRPPPRVCGPGGDPSPHPPARPHVPHIRNPRLRQYYLKESTWGLEEAGVKPTALDKSSNGKDGSNDGDTHLRVPDAEEAPSSASSPSLDPTPEPVPPGSLASPSPDAEYDKLLDVEAVPMPDGQLCLLALPPECSEGEGPIAMPYLKLYCRYITDRKGVVSGVLLVTPNKIFFDPYKSHPLVVEHGCEEYLLSCSVDGLRSVSFCPDISHVHFSGAAQRVKGRRKETRLKKAKNLARKSQGIRKGETVLALVSSAAPGPSPGEGGAESRDAVGAERAESAIDELAAQSAGVLGAGVLGSAATFCCGGLDAGDKRSAEGAEGPQAPRKGLPALSPQTPGSHGALMFLRLRFHPPHRKKKVGSVKSPQVKDAWFALSQESSDELYAYLSHWRPDLCILEGSEEDGENEEFVLVDDGQDEVSQVDGQAGDEWEMVSVEEGGGKSLVLDREPEGLGDILEQSNILEADHVRRLSSELPPRTVGHTWRLAYSTSRHGSSLRSLYRKLSGSDSPSLIVIKDSRGQVFGAFLSHPLRPSESFYGTGETFLFTVEPRFECFHWTGENSFFIKGDLDSFAIGGGSGHFGLWLDEMLYLGRSSPCCTFDNRCLAGADDFRVVELEVWTFC